jgi:hypothetical protein
LISICTIKIVLNDSHPKVQTSCVGAFRFQPIPCQCLHQSLGLFLTALKLIGISCFLLALPLRQDRQGGGIGFGKRLIQEALSNLLKRRASRRRRSLQSLLELSIYFDGQHELKYMMMEWHLYSHENCKSFTSSSTLVEPL